MKSQLISALCLIPLSFSPALFANTGTSNALPTAPQKSAKAPDCQAQRLMASYTIENKSPQNTSQKTTFQLTREAQRVFHQYSNTDFTEQWTESKDRSVSLIKHHNKSSHAISFKSTEIQRPSWQRKYEIVSPELLTQMQMVASEGEGCETKQHFSMTQGTRTISISWMPYLKVPSAMTFIQGKGISSHWTLESLSQTAKSIKQYTHKLDQQKHIAYSDLNKHKSKSEIAEMLKKGVISRNIKKQP